MDTRSRSGLRRSIGVSTVALVCLLSAVVGLQPAAAQESLPPLNAVLCGQPGEVTTRLYRLYFNREPDAAGLTYWSGVYQETKSYDTVAFWMAKSSEYRAQWDEVSDEEFVSGLLYNNLLNRPPDATGFAYWVGLLETNERSNLSQFWVVQPELTARHPVNEPADCALLDQVQNIPGGRALAIDYSTTDLKTSSTRCAVMSINANWVHSDGAVPFSEHIGFANIDGVNVPSRGNVNDDNSRGIFGARRIGEGGEVPNFSHTFDTNVGSLNLLSNLTQKNGSMLQLHANYWDSPTFANGSPNEWYDEAKFGGQEAGWDWAVGGISMVVAGQQNVVTAGQSYTFNTTRHSFAAFKAPSTVMLGSTTAMTAQQMVDWLVARGYTDIMKMDGGGSVEFNEGGFATVAGTPRPLPVWLGIGC